MHSCKSYIHFAHHIFPACFASDKVKHSSIADHGVPYQNKAVDLLEEFDRREQEGGDKGIKKNNLKISIMKELMT